MLGRSCLLQITDFNERFNNLPVAEIVNSSWKAKAQMRELVSDTAACTIWLLYSLHLNQIGSLALLILGGWLIICIQGVN